MNITEILKIEPDEFGWRNLPYGGRIHKDVVLKGGEIRGGEVCGGVLRGGEVWGGIIRGGIIFGGKVWGGEIYGGVVYSGVIRETPPQVAGKYFMNFCRPGGSKNRVRGTPNFCLAQKREKNCRGTQRIRMVYKSCRAVIGLVRSAKRFGGGTVSVGNNCRMHTVKDAELYMNSNWMGHDFEKDDTAGDTPQESFSIYRCKRCGKSFQYFYNIPDEKGLDELIKELGECGVS